MGALLEVTGVTVRYGAVEAVREISLRVEEGEVVTLIGANGAGKSTTLRAISRLVPLQRGEIVFAGRTLNRLAPDRVVRFGVAHAPEGRQVLARQNVEDNLRLGAYLRRDRAGILADLERLYRIFPRLADRRRQLAGTLSGGEQQMLAIARALMSRPRLLLLDEPSLGLAPLLVREIFAVLRALAAEGTTLLLVEQNARLAMQHAHRTYVLEAGRVTIAGPSAELIDDLRVRQAYLGE